MDYGKSYVNLTKGTNGGSVEPGDTLEIRATFVVKAGTSGSYYADSCAFLDAIPAGTAYIPQTLAVRTNEGKIYKAFTDAITDDAGWINGSNIQINLGYNTAPKATAVRRGRIVNTDKPSFYGSSCIMVASYRVKVTAAYGTKLSVGGGTITYRPFGGALKTIVFNRTVSWCIRTLAYVQTRLVPTIFFQNQMVRLDPAKPRTGLNPAKCR